jgi:hypothetical protein
VVLHRPDPVETHLLGVDGLVDAVADDLPLVFGGGVGELGLEDHRELHGEPPVFRLVIYLTVIGWERKGCCSWS